MANGTSTSCLTAEGLRLYSVLGDSAASTSASSSSGSSSSVSTTSLDESFFNGSFRLTAPPTQHLRADVRKQHQRGLRVSDILSVWLAIQLYDIHCTEHPNFIRDDLRHLRERHAFVELDRERIRDGRL